MTQQIINIGASPNDGDGDNLRTAFDKVNDNFTAIWGQGPVDSNVSIAGNTISTISVNTDLALSPNGTGNIKLNNNTVPGANNTWYLGSISNRWRGLYVGNIVAGNITIATSLEVPGDVTIGGNLTVEGDTIQIGNIVTDTKTIQLANTASTANAANGSGITVGANDNIATMLYSSTSNTWVMNVGANITGNVTAPYFIGNGALLTGITSYANANAVAYGQAGWAGNIIPAGNAVYSLGNATNQWADLWVSNSTIYMNSVPITLGAGNVLTVNGEPVLINDSNTSITTTGNITADFFIGDGSQLSNVSSTGNLEIVGTTIGIAPGASETSIFVGNGPAGLAMNQDSNNLAYLKLSANTTGSSFFEESFGYSSGSYTSDGSGGGTITLTGATDVEQFLNNLNFPGSVVSLEINGTDTVPYGGASYGGGTVQLSTSTPPAVDPTVVTSIRFNIVYENQFVIDDDEGNFGIYIGNENFDIESIRDINITSGDDLTIRANDNFELSTKGTDITLTTNYLGISKNLNFNTDGNITFPGALRSDTGANNGYLTWVPNSSGDGLGYTTLKLVPDSTVENNDQYLIVDPTVPSHIHIRAGGTQDNSSTSLFLGGENSYFQVPAGSNPSVYVVANGNSWQFDTDGVLSAPGNITTSGDITANAFIGDGSQLTGLPPEYTDSDVANLLSSFGSNSISTTGNITAGNLLLPNTTANTQVLFNNSGVVDGVSQFTFDPVGNTLTLANNNSTLKVADIQTPAGGVSLRLIPASGITYSYGNFLPLFANTYDLGGSGSRWNNMWANVANVVTLNTTGNITGGNLLTSGIAKITTASGGQGEFQIGDASSTSFVVGVGSAGATWAGAASLNLITSSSPGGNIGIFVAQNERARFTSSGLSVTGSANATGTMSATSITLSGTGTAVNASSGNILTNKVTGTQFAFLNGLYTATLTGAGATSDYTLNLPANAGSNGQVLTTDGTGNLSWGTPASSYGNANVATFLANYGSNTISTTGNIVAGNLIGNISITGNVTGTSPNVTLVAGSYSYVFDNTGELTLPAVGGDEGGQINMTVPLTNTTLENKVSVDVYQNKFRIFEGSANARGVSLDLAKSPTGVGGELMWKVSGVVNAGTFVTLDNLKVTVTSSANYGLSIAAVSGSFTANISGWYGASGGGAGSSLNNLSVTTTPSNSLFGWNFVAEGDGAQYTIVDKTNSRMYRVTLVIGSAYNNNFISIERLY